MKDNRWDITSSCEDHIYEEFKNMGEKYKIPKEEWEQFAADCSYYVESEIDNIEIERDLEDLDIDEIITHCGNEGWFVMKAASLREMEKIEAFMEKLKENPYGKMIII